MKNFLQNFSSDGFHSIILRLPYQRIRCLVSRGKKKKTEKFQLEKFIHQSSKKDLNIPIGVELGVKISLEGICRTRTAVVKVEVTLWESPTVLPRSAKARLIVAIQGCIGTPCTHSSSNTNIQTTSLNGYISFYIPLLVVKSNSPCVFAKHLIYTNQFLFSQEKRKGRSKKSWRRSRSLQPVQPFRAFERVRKIGISTGDSWLVPRRLAAIFNIFLHG